MMILDTRTLDHLAGIIGQARLDQMLDEFLGGLRRDEASLEQMTEGELLVYVHSCTSMAGHFGFMELSYVCEEAHNNLRKGTNYVDFAAMRDASQRAITAARAHGLAVAV